MEVHHRSNLKVGKCGKWITVVETSVSELVDLIDNCTVTVGVNEISIASLAKLSSGLERRNIGIAVVGKNVIISAFINILKEIVGCFLVPSITVAVIVATIFLALDELSRDYALLSVHSSTFLYGTPPTGNETSLTFAAKPDSIVSVYAKVGAFGWYFDVLTDY